mmetsp:Transcript_1507/g.4722  ORF Transcript_1507/g.4722 Transcript_1507/m.4722 type:complete len:125 (+) Transcript_1507:26-400(+)
MNYATRTLPIPLWLLDTPSLWTKDGISHKNLTPTSDPYLTVATTLSFPFEKHPGVCSSSSLSLYLFESSLCLLGFGSLVVVSADNQITRGDIHAAAAASAVRRTVSGRAAAAEDGADHRRDRSC